MRLFKPTYRDKKTGETRTVAKWWIELRDHLQIVRRFPAFKDKAQSAALGRRIERLATCRASGDPPDRELTEWLERVPPKLLARFVKIGLLDSTRAAAGKRLSRLVNDFVRHLEAKERTAKYVGECRFMLQRIFRECRFTAFSDINRTKVEAYLKDLRDNGLSARRSNGYLTALKGFCRWMVDTGQASESPVRGLRKLNEKTDVRRERRAGTPDEMRKLIATTTQGPERFGMAGPERALLYRFCAMTGLRANECRRLTVGDIDLDGLVVRVRAAYSKHRDIDTIPLRKDLVEALSCHLADRLPTSKVFGGRYRRLTLKTAEMLQTDLQAAGIPYQDEQGRFFDFHATRHTFITNLRHAPSRVAQSLARHKSSAMTDRYTHVRLHDERAALDLLPDLSAPDRQVQKATGTDGKCVDAQSDLASNLAFPDAGTCSTMQSPAETDPTGAIKNANSNAPGRTRTCNLRIRSPRLCPIELRARELRAWTLYQAGRFPVNSFGLGPPLASAIHICG